MNKLRQVLLDILNLLFFVLTKSVEFAEKRKKYANVKSQPDQIRWDTGTVGTYANTFSLKYPG